MPYPQAGIYSHAQQMDRELVKPIIDMIERVRVICIHTYMYILYVYIHTYTSYFRHVHTRLTGGQRASQTHHRHDRKSTRNRRGPNGQTEDENVCEQLS